ncbi:hypothetical protein [Kitasatospora sp. NPDC101183]|uniref:hypothetical protein n=1 Tax=Kitasatospora sp. NPDC101183 TaxID=3364100 RepID=UPI00380B2619
MLTVRVTVVDAGGTPPTTAAARIVEDILWAHAAPEHGLEHVRATPAPDGIAVMLFLRADDRAHAVANAERLLSHALSAGTAHRYAAAIHLS